MRLATCLVAALLSTTTLTTQIASACGGSYESVRKALTLMPVSSHVVHTRTEGGGPANSRRAFAIYQTRSDLGDDLPWEVVSPMSYDSTSFVELAKLDHSFAVTLVGPSGTRVVRTARRVALHNALWQSGSTFEAVELPVTSTDDIAIAIAGSHRDAVWHPLEGSYTFTNTVAGTDLSGTLSHGGGEPSVTLTVGKQTLGTWAGYLTGAVDVDGSRYAVITRRDGTLFTVAVRS